MYTVYNIESSYLLIIEKLMSDCTMSKLMNFRSIEIIYNEFSMAATKKLYLS